MPQIPGHLLITTYDGVRGGHLLAEHGDAVYYLCPAHRDQQHQVRHFWWVYEIDDPHAPAVDCAECAAVLNRDRP